jgi:hypothetical protein
MAKKTAESGTAEKKPRKARTSAPKHFIAEVFGAATPVIVVARTQADAINALLTLTPATASDLMRAGAEGYSVVDLSVVASNVTPIVGEAA